MEETIIRKIITPQEAEEILKRRNKKNRSLTRQTWKSYALDMMNNNWNSGHDPIVINNLGELENGQHRLAAVVYSKKPQMFTIIINAEPNMESYDRGRPRTINDAMTIRLQKNGINIARINTKVAITRFLFDMYFSISKLSDEMIFSYLNDHENNMSLTTSLTCKSRNKKSILKKAPVQTAVYIALECGVPFKDLDDFCQIAVTGFYDSYWQTSPIILKSMLETYDIGKNKNNRNIGRFITECSIKDFTSHNPRKKQYKMSPEFGFYSKKYKEKFISENKDLVHSSGVKL